MHAPNPIDAVHAVLREHVEEVLHVSCSPVVVTGTPLHPELVVEDRHVVAAGEREGVVDEHGFQEILVHVEDLRTVGGTEYLGPSLEDHVARHGGRVGVGAPVRLLTKPVWEEVVERVDDVRLVDEGSIVELPRFVVGSGPTMHGVAGSTW